MGASNIRPRILAPAIKHANEQLAKAKVQPLPDGLTPQSLRRTYASLLYAVCESPVYVKGQIGQTDATLTLSYDAREMDRRDGEPKRLKALVDGRELVATGSTLIVSDPVEEDVEPAEPVESGTLPE